MHTFFKLINNFVTDTLSTSLSTYLSTLSITVFVFLSYPVHKTLSTFK